MTERDRVDQILRDIARGRPAAPVVPPPEDVLEGLRMRGRARRRRRSRAMALAATTVVAATGLIGLTRLAGQVDGDDQVNTVDRPPATSNSTATTETTTSTTTTPSSTPAPTTATTGGEPSTSVGGTGGGGTGGRGCAANGGVVPVGAVSAGVVDVDGDGHRDRVWYSFAGSGQRVGIATASGLVVSTTVDTAKGVQGVVVVDADQRGPVEVLIDDGATGFLYVFAGCDLVPVIGPDDGPYMFDLGYRGNGTGVVCTDADGDGSRDLVGVNFMDNGDGTATLSRTVIELDGTTARHGHHDEQTVPGYQQDPQASRNYYGIHCGPYALTPEMITP